MVAQEIVYFKRINNKTVHTISNFHDTEQTMILRRQRDGSRLECHCPTAVKDYNSYIGRVDKAVMLCSIYGVGHKSKKWWHRIFFGLVSRTLCNAYVVYKKLIESSIRSLEFHHSISQSLITLNVGRPLPTSSHGSVKKRRKVSCSVPDLIRLQNIGAHYVIYTSERGRCEACSERSIHLRPHSKSCMCNVFLCCNEFHKLFQRIP